MGTIDENALQTLSLIINLSKQLEVKGQVAENLDPDTVSQYFPSFLWVVRDFALRLQDQHCNEISSKQYLENALKEQKGTSDAVEQKNKIRRLIGNYFKEKDCYTMVRPTEQEKDLQNVQQLEDSHLRPEFLSQMQLLRNKVFKRIRPKQLNGRSLTGLMFVELCQAYTESINAGSVPNIENAWSSLCKNENLRAIKQAVASYESQMDKGMYKDADRKECIEYRQLKQLNKQVTQSVTQTFKQSAFGELIEAAQAKIEKEIEEKWQAIKARFARDYQKQLKQQIQALVTPIESKIRMNQFKTPQDLMQDMNQLKQDFASAAPESGCKDRELAFSQECERLVFKGMEHLYINASNSSQGEKRHLTEQVTFLEQQL